MEPYILILKYIFKSKGKALPDSCNSLEDFFQSGIYFPQFIALIYDLDSVPNTTKSPKSIMAKNINNNAAFDYLTSQNSFFKNINSDFSNDKNRVNVIKNIIEKEYFKSTNKDCLSKCNQYLKQNNDTITSFSEFNNIIGFLKLFAAFSKCSVYEILIQYIKSFDIPVVISKESFNTNQDILIFQALIILKQLQEGSSSIQQTSQLMHSSNQPQNLETNLPAYIEAKNKLSTDSNLIFEILPNSNDQKNETKEHNLDDKELVLDADINRNTISTQASIETKKHLSKNSNIICDFPLKDIPEELKRNEQLNNEVLDEYQQKEIENLNNLVNELNHQKEELNAELQIQYEEKKRLNQESIEKDNKLNNLNNMIEQKSKQIENLSSNVEKLERSQRNLEEAKKQEIEKLITTNAKLNENLRNIQNNVENQKATSYSEIINLKKQISDLNNQKLAYEALMKKQIIYLNKQKEATETEMKKQILNLNKEKELTEVELKKQIRDLETKLREKATSTNDTYKNNDESRPISQIVQPLWQDQEQSSTQNKDIKLDQNQETDFYMKSKKTVQPSSFWVSLPGLMNFF